ncbi:MAG: response regulator [Pseudobdellovibrio sp.]
MYLGMALRVLLADESSTIKKAIQMVLSDYGVEVKTVPTGIDVLSVTQSFMPDIIIADILLNKKNGYEVCLELKTQEDTKNIPVVLMWSSFMQLDDQLFKGSRADASLEKPFETETIRNLVEKLVPKLQTFPLKGFLNHAPMPNFEESDTFVRQKTDYNTLSQSQAPTQATTTSFEIKHTSTQNNVAMDIPIVENSKNNTTTGYVIDDASVSKKTKTEKSSIVVEAELPPQQDEWSSAKTNQFVIETENFGDFEEVKVINSISDDTPDLQKKINEQIQNYLKDSPVAVHKSQNQLKSSSAHSSFDEQLMREEIRQIAERICWQIIPEVTERVVREELGKLLQGIENNI